MTKNKAIIIFTTNDNCSWFLRPLKKNFRHCFIIIQDKGAYVKIEYCYNKTYTNILTNEEIEELLNGDTITNVVYYNIPNCVIANFRLGVFTCVSLTKSILGINKWYILTPYQLYKYLTK